MRIGELARRAGVTTRALRYYEAQGLLPATRAPNGYREYGESAVRRVGNIRRLLAVGFTSDEIRAFIPCLDSQTAFTAPCPPQAPVIAAKLTALQTEIDELTGIRDRLAGLLEVAAGRHLSEAG
jgi:DNA-binding transcriptional MerR regulator